MAGIVIRRAGSPSPWLPLLLFLALSAWGLVGCSSRQGDDLGDDLPEIAGAWEGRLTVIHNGRERDLPVTLVLHRDGHTLTGDLQAETPGLGAGAGPGGTELDRSGARGSLAGRRFELTQGLAAEGQVFFHARAWMPIGAATLVFHGTVDMVDAVDTGDEDIGSRRLEGAVEVDVSTTEGSLHLPGRLEARPAAGGPPTEAPRAESR